MVTRPDNPKDLMSNLLRHLLVEGLQPVDGPHVVSDQKTVLYVQSNSGTPRMRIEITQ